MFIDDYILEKILDFTNEKITEITSKYRPTSFECHHYDHCDMVELEAFLGLLYLAGVFKSNHEDIKFPLCY